MSCGGLASTTGEVSAATSAAAATAFAFRIVCMIVLGMCSFRTYVVESGIATLADQRPLHVQDPGTGELVATLSFEELVEIGRIAAG